MNTDALALKFDGDPVANLVEAQLAVTDAETYKSVGEFVKTATRFEKLVHAELDPLCQDADRAHKNLVAFRSKYLTQAELVKRVGGRNMAVWQTEHERIRREQEESARRERERLEAEERARVSVEEERLRREAEERQLEEAAAAEAIGDMARAEQIVSTPVVVTPVTPKPVFVAPPPAPAARVEGVSFREEWDFEIINPSALPREYLMPDEKKIRGVVRAMKGATSIPGVRAFARKTAAVRA